MSVRFVLGRAGAGKTHYCLSEIASRLEESAAEGQRLFLLVPEQASMQMERTLLECPGIEGFARCEVLSFRRLAHRVLGACGGGANTISDTGRLMIIRRLIDQHAGELRIFGSRRGRRGLVDRISRTLDELIREDVTVDELAEARNRLSAENDALAARLADVELLYRGYVERLGDELTDPGHHLSIVRERLDAYPDLRGALMWVDGFAGLARQELRLLVALAERVERAEVSLLMDPDSRVLQGDVPIEPFHLYARTERTYALLNQALRSAEVEVDDPLVLGGPNPRFASSPVLAALEQGLFSYTTRPKRIAIPGDELTANVRFVQAATRRVEIAAAVTEIQRLVRQSDNPLRYRDIAIIVRNLEPYHDLLTAALTAAGIPHFIDRRRPIAHHALVEFVRTAIDLARNADVESVSAFIKTGLAGLDEDDGDLLENHLRAQGIDNRTRWQGEDWTICRRPSQPVDADALTPDQTDQLARLNKIRRQLLAAWEPWWQLADASEACPAELWARGLFELLERFGVPQQIAAWADDADRLGRLDEAAEHRQVWTHLVDLLDDLSGTFADEALSLEELAEVVDTALGSSTLGLTPPTVDQVLVGSIERSRHPKIRAALILGFSEGEFPQRPAEDPIFSDQQRIELSRSGVELAPTSRQHLFDEKLLAYIALTRPDERLWVSWPAAEEDGRVLQPSPFVAAVRSVLPDLEIVELPEPAPSRQTWAVTTTDDLAAAIAADVRGRTMRPNARAEDDARWDALYDWARSDKTVRGPLRRALESLVYDNDAVLLDDAVKRLYADPLQTSVSRIETFAACPFQHFARFALGLDERAEWELDAIDLGLLSHRVLEDYVAQLIKTGSRLDDVPLDELGSLVRNLSQRALGEMVDALISGDARNAYLIERQNLDLVRTLQAQRFVAEAGAYHPAGVEVCFGLDPPAESREGRTYLPALAIATPKGRAVRLRGRIDRVDLAELGDRALGTVVDYKHSTRSRLRLDHVFHGLDLQLLTYLLVLAEHGDQIAREPVEPSGAFYAALRDDLRRLDGPPEEPPDQAERYRELRPRGILDFDNRTSFDPILDAGGATSNVVAARVNRNGAPGHVDATDSAEHDAFGALLDFVRRQLGVLCDRLLDGVIDIDPYRLGDERPCTYCPYQSVCRFEFDAHRPRRLQRMRRLEVFSAIGHLSGGASDA